MKHTGLCFGSFNPIHNGHLIIANYMLEFTDLDQIFFVVSVITSYSIHYTKLYDNTITI